MAVTDDRETTPWIGARWFGRHCAKEGLPREPLADFNAEQTKQFLAGYDEVASGAWHRVRRISMNRNILWMIVLTILLIGSLAFAATHPNRALAKCDFLWFGEFGLWSCPK